MFAEEVTLDLLVNAYLNGLFPMSEGRDDTTLFWVEPEERGIFPLDGFHVSRSLKKLIKKQPFTVKINTAFKAVMQACAESDAGRETTWISHPIEDLYSQLHEHGLAHSVECWQDDTLVGGLYGVCLRGGFFGESMFSRQPNASKVALVYLIARLNKGGFTLLDSQFQTDHLATMGCVEMDQADYKILLKQAIENEKADFYSLPTDFGSTSASTILQLSTQTS